MKQLLIYFLLMMCAMLAGSRRMYAGNDEKPGVKAVAVAASRATWEFNAALPDYSGHAYAKADERLFGRDIACLLALLDERYVRREQIAAGDPAVQAHLANPLVYNAAKQIVRSFRQKGKRGMLAAAECGQLGHVLKVALACVEEEASGFEAALRENRKDTGMQLDCFLRVKLRNIYE